MLGSSVSVRSSGDNVSVSIQTLTKNLTPTLELANEIIRKPGFNEEDFLRLKKQQMESIQNQNTQAGAIANKVFDKLIYGEKNIQGIPEMGTVSTLENIQLKDVQQFYQDYFSPNKSNLVIVGDIAEDEVLSQLGFLRDWTGPEVKIPENMKVSSQPSKTIYLVNKEKSAQSEIRIGHYTGIKYEPLGLYYKAYLNNYNLGGAFNSRINLNLREDKGYTYGARSRFDSDDFGGVFVASAGVKLDASSESVKEFMKEINNYYQTGISESEIEFMKKSIGQREALSYESPFQKANFLRRIVKYDLESSYTMQQNEILQGITKKELDGISKKFLNPNDMIILVVGDEEVIRKELQSIGYPVIVLDKEGNEKVEPKVVQPIQEKLKEVE
jgi:zinc protease